jgi:hypothetical protein
MARKDKGEAFIASAKQAAFAACAVSRHDTLLTKSYLGLTTFTGTAAMIEAKRFRWSHRFPPVSPGN